MFTVRQVDPILTRPLRQRVLRPHLTIEQMEGSEPGGAVAFAAFSGDQLVAAGMILPEGEPGAWRIRGMAAAPEVRGRGAGTVVLEALLDHAWRSGATRVWCNARIAARTLYERAGMVCTSDVFEIPDIGPHYVMEVSRGPGS